MHSSHNKGLEVCTVTVTSWRVSYSLTSSIQYHHQWDTPQLKRELSTWVRSCTMTAERGAKRKHGDSGKRDWDACCDCAGFNEFEVLFAREGVARAKQGQLTSGKRWAKHCV